jgi:hypothetical protein
MTKPVWNRTDKKLPTRGRQPRGTSDEQLVREYIEVATAAQRARFFALTFLEQVAVAKRSRFDELFPGEPNDGAA